MYELDRVTPHLPKNSAVLEIGAGAGWQSKELSRRGVAVTAIDIATSYYKPDQIWPVIEYDGLHIPFPDNYFDIVFSSNVLEHIPHVRSFQSELQRVLKPGGTAIHLLPSGTWRFWSTVAHYPWLVAAAFNHLFKRRSAAQPEKKTHSPAAPAVSKREIIRGLIAPERHGEFGNTITEIYYFSRFRWARLFRSTGWKIEHYYSNRLFYTGYSIFDSRLSIRSRRILSYLLGSACHVFVLKKTSGLSTAEPVLRRIDRPGYPRTEDAAERVGTAASIVT